MACGLNPAFPPKPWLHPNPQDRLASSNSELAAALATANGLLRRLGHPTDDGLHASAAAAGGGRRRLSTDDPTALGLPPNTALTPGALTHAMQQLAAQVQERLVEARVLARLAGRGGPAMVAAAAAEAAEPTQRPRHSSPSRRIINPLASSPRAPGPAAPRDARLGSPQGAARSGPPPAAAAPTNIRPASAPAASPPPAPSGAAGLASGTAAAAWHQQQQQQDRGGGLARASSGSPPPPSSLSSDGLGVFHELRNLKVMMLIMSLSLSSMDVVHVQHPFMQHLAFRAARDAHTACHAAEEP